MRVVTDGKEMFPYSVSVTSSASSGDGRRKEHVVDDDDASFYATLRPLASVCKLLGTYPLKNVFQAHDRTPRFRLLSLDVVYAFVVHSTTTALYSWLEDNEWLCFLLPLAWIRSALAVLLSLSVYDRHLPTLITGIQKFDATFEKLSSRRATWKTTRLNGQVWLAIGCFTVVVCFLQSAVERLDAFSLVVTALETATLLPRYLYNVVYMFFCAHLASRFVDVRVLWQDAVDEALRDDGLVATSSGLRLEQARLLHGELARAARRLAACYGGRLALFFFAVFVEAIIDMFHTTHIIVNPGSLAQLVFYVGNFAAMFWVATLSDQVAGQAASIQEEVESVPLSRLRPACQTQVQVFLCSLATSKLKISAAGFCTVDRKLLVTMAISLAAYFVILVGIAYKFYFKFIN